jgi:hypothetical protein
VPPGDAPAAFALSRRDSTVSRARHPLAPALL